MGQDRVKLRSPVRWATDISSILNTVRGLDHFPVSVKEVAIDLSRNWFPDDPLSLVQGAHLPGFDGALFPAPSGEKGWGIFYNSSIASPGRINFTLAHEFGHYLSHRLKYPDGMRCSQQDVVRWDSQYRQIEHEANTFAAYMLMPLDDFRRQLDPQAAPTLDSLSDCADRYGVSVIAATLRWLSYTQRRAVLVVSRDGFILWARSSEPAFRSGVYIKSSGSAVPIPEGSVAANPQAREEAMLGVNLAPGVWFQEACREVSIFAENYDFTLSLIHLPPGGGRSVFDGSDPVEGETLGDTIRRNHGL